MAAEASVNAMYARKIAETGDPGERAAYVGARLAGAEDWTRGPQRRHHHISPV